MKTRFFALALLYVALLTSPGCAYFRWSDPSYDELHERAQQEKAADKEKFQPGAVFQKPTGSGQ